MKTFACVLLLALAVSAAPNVPKRYPMGVLPGSNLIPMKKQFYDNLDVNAIPTTFDARQRWPECVKVIGNIRDQSQCGSCWAVAAASVFSDRKCISSGGKVQTSFSGEDTLSCCHGDGSAGCNGGYPSAAWDWFVQVGVVSGGNYTNRDGCRPYLFCPPGVTHSCKTPSCQQTCDGNGNMAYASDKHKADTSYRIDSNVAQIQTDLMNKGSVEVTFAVYEDFFNYPQGFPTGVYTRTPGSRLAGYHAVRLIGWGTQQGVDYWLIANSWDTNWGNDGYFMIKRGVNECGIEDDPTAGDVNGDA
jgi:cathepsin B